MKKFTIYIGLFLILMFNVYGYDNIYSFDMNEDIIITTTVYNSSRLECLDCVCNMTIYYPHPNETIIYLNTLLNNNNNGVYTINLERNLSYNKYIYPLTIICTQPNGLTGGESREGIKVGETTFDYTSLMMILFGIGAALIFASFKIDAKLYDLRLTAFFGSFLFFIGGTFTGLQIAKLSPASAGFIIIFDIMFYTILAIFMVMIYFYAKHRIAATLENNN